MGSRLLTNKRGVAYLQKKRRIKCAFIRRQLEDEEFIATDKSVSGKADNREPQFAKAVANHKKQQLGNRAEQ